MTAPPMYAWDVHELGGARLGASGVTEQQDTAVENLLQALRTAPRGSDGEIRTARLTFDALPSPAYVYGVVLVHAYSDPETGEIHVDRAEMQFSRPGEGYVEGGLRRLQAWMGSL